MSDGGDDCWLCGGCGEVDATSAVTPVPETVGCPVCIAAEKGEQLEAARALLKRTAVELGYTRDWLYAQGLTSHRLNNSIRHISVALAQTEERAG